MRGSVQFRLIHAVGLLLVASLLGAACGSAAQDDLTIGAYSLDESRVLAELVRQVLVADGSEATVHEYLSREELMAALDEGEIDVAVEYLASLLAFYGYLPERTSEEALSDLEESRGEMLVSVAPAHAGRGLVVRAEFAGKHGVRSIAGLAGIVDRMVVGGPTGCPTSPTCLLGLEAIYGYSFEGFTPINEPDVLVAALEAAQVDAAVLFVTDPTMVGKDLFLLTDDLGMHGWEHPILLERSGSLTAASKAALTHVWEALDTDALRDLNARATLQGRETAVADFLEQSGRG